MLWSVGLLAHVVLGGHEWHLADHCWHCFLSHFHLDRCAHFTEASFHVAHGNILFEAGGGASTGDLTLNKVEFGMTWEWIINDFELFCKTHTYNPAVRWQDWCVLSNRWSSGDQSHSLSRSLCLYLWNNDVSTREISWLSTTLTLKHTQIH